MLENFRASVLNFQAFALHDTISDIIALHLPPPVQARIQDFEMGGEFL